VTNRTEKSYALSGVRTVAEEVGCHTPIADLLISAVDEMIISMLYGTQTDPSTIGMKPISVECGSDGRFLCVGVLDEYGSSARRTSMRAWRSPRSIGSIKCPKKRRAPISVSGSCSRR